MSNSVVIKDYRKEIPGKMITDRTPTWIFPTLVSVNSHGKKTEWKIIVRLTNRGDDSEFLPILDSYFDNKPMPENVWGWIKVLSKIEGGKIRDTEATVVKEGKNKGRANATNVFCQALRDALGLHNKHAKKTIAPEELEKEAKIGPDKKCEEKRYPPMLAQPIGDIEVDWSRAFLQRKYNGVRTVATLEGGRVVLYGRRKLEYAGLEHIKTELEPILRKYWDAGRCLYLDGELYKHGAPLQEISGLVRKEEKGGDTSLKFMIYDCFMSNEPDLIYSQRRAILDETIVGDNKYLINVETFPCESKARAEELYRTFLAEKYEGAMVRVDLPYRYSYNEYHSRNLLKMKPTYDEEFEVIGWTTGKKGKAANAVMIICQTPDGKQFNVTPAMELPDRIELAAKMANGDYFEREYKGKMVRVYFDEYSVDNVPQRARTKLERLGVDIYQ